MGGFHYLDRPVSSESYQSCFRFRYGMCW